MQKRKNDMEKKRNTKMNSDHFMPALSCSFVHFTGLQNESYKNRVDCCSSNLR